MYPFRLSSEQTNYPPHKRATRQTGITLIESLISLSVIGILALSAVSYGGQYAINLSIESELTALQQHIAYARSEARTFDTEVRLCQSDDGELCTRGSNWAKGWIAYHNVTGDWTRNSAADTLLYTHTAADSRVTVRLCNGDSVLINHDGYLRKNGRFVIKSTDPDNKQYKKLVMTQNDNTRIVDGVISASDEEC